MATKLKISQFDEHDTGTLCAELSMLRCEPPNKNTVLHLEENGRIRTFNFVKTDTDENGEDVYGWNFSDSNTGQKLLIIND
jgi:hypothetical protein